MVKKWLCVVFPVHDLRRIMEKTNLKVRLAAREAGVHQWEIAEALGIGEGSFCRRMRHELPEAEQARILETINDISTQREENFYADLYKKGC